MGKLRDILKVLCDFLRVCVEHDKLALQHRMVFGDVPPASSQNNGGEEAVTPYEMITQTGKNIHLSPVHLNSATSTSTVPPASSQNNKDDQVVTQVLQAGAMIYRDENGEERAIEVSDVAAVFNVSEWEAARYFRPVPPNIGQNNGGEDVQHTLGTVSCIDRNGEIHYIEVKAALPPGSGQNKPVAEPAKQRRRRIYKKTTK